MKIIDMLLSAHCVELHAFSVFLHVCFSFAHALVSSHSWLNGDFELPEGANVNCMICVFMSCDELGHFSIHFVRLLVRTPKKDSHKAG